MLGRPETFTALVILAVVLAGHVLGSCLNLKGLERRLAAPALGMSLAALMVLCLLLIPDDARVFIYFQF